MEAENTSFGIVFILIGVSLSFIIPILIHLYPRLPLIPNPRKWEKLPEEVQLEAIKGLRRLSIKLYIVGGIVFILLGAYTLKYELQYEEINTAEHVKKDVAGKKTVPKVPGASKLFDWFIDRQKS